MPTGSGGNIGTGLTDLLRGAGHEVVLSDINPPPTSSSSPAATSHPIGRVQPGAGHRRL